MKPIIKDTIAIFSPAGFIDGENSALVIEPSDESFLYANTFECVLVSMKKVRFFNKRGLNNIVEILNRVRIKTGAIIGFCDYDEAKFKAFFEMYEKKITFCLFDSAEVAGLFFGKNLPHDTKVILHSQQNDQKNQIAIQLAQKGIRAFVAQNKDEFDAKKGEFDYSICLTHISSSNRNFGVSVQDNVVIYKLSGYIDTDFWSKFDVKYQENSLKVGFKYFLFDASEVISFNIHGVSFLAKLSTASAEYGATIAIFGLNSKNTTEVLRDDLEDAGILLYDTIEDFYQDESVISGGAGILSNKPRNITKRLIEILSKIINPTLDTISVVTKLKVHKNSVKVDVFKNAKPGLIGSNIGFYGDIEGTIFLGVDEILARKICFMLLEDGAKREVVCAAFGEFMGILGRKVIANLESEYQNIYLTMPKVFDDCSVFANGVGKGALIEFNAGEFYGVLFLNN